MKGQNIHLGTIGNNFDRYRFHFMFRFNQIDSVFPFFLPQFYGRELFNAKKLMSFFLLFWFLFKRKFNFFSFICIWIYKFGQNSLHFSISK